MQSDVCFDIIPAVVPSVKTVEEFGNELSKGDYNWLFDAQLKKKTGHLIPGINNLVYNYVVPDNGDYMLNIQINMDVMKITISQIDKYKNKLNKIYAVETNIGTVGEKMIASSVPIENFDKYLNLAIDLKCEYHNGNDEPVIEQMDSNQEQLASKLSKLKGLNLE